MKKLKGLGFVLLISISQALAWLTPRSSWDCFMRHKGSWAGVQNLFDYSGDSPSTASGPHKLTGSALISKTDSIESVAYLIKSSDIDWASSTPVSSDSMTTQPLAKFSPSNMLSSNLKFLDCAIVGGPNIVPNTQELTFQISLVSENLRLKLQVIYEPFDSVNIKGTSFQIPFSFVLSDVIITRESKVSGERDFVPSIILDAVEPELKPELNLASLDQRPIKLIQRLTVTNAQLDEEPNASHEHDNLFPLHSLSDRLPIVFHTESVELPSSQNVFKAKSDGKARAIEEEDDDDDDDDDAVEMQVVSRHGTDILVELPRVVVAAERVSARLTWMPNRQSCVIAAEALFSAMHCAIKPTKRRGGLAEQIDQPILEKLEVSRFSIEDSS